MITILSILLGLQLSLGDCNNELYSLPDTIAENYFEQQYFLTFNAEIFLYEYFYVKGAAKLLVYSHNKDVLMYPRALSSCFELGALLHGLKVGWKHFCTHPIVPWYGDNGFVQFYDESGDEFFIQYETEKIKIF